MRVKVRIWPFDLRVSARRGPATDYMSIDFGADSSSSFPFRVQINKQTRLNALHHAGGYTAGVGNDLDEITLEYLHLIECIWF